MREYIGLSYVGKPAPFSFPLRPIFTCGIMGENKTAPGLNFSLPDRMEKYGAAVICRMYQTREKRGEQHELSG